MKIDGRKEGLKARQIDVSLSQRRRGACSLHMGRPAKFLAHPYKGPILTPPTNFYANCSAEADLRQLFGHLYQLCNQW